MSNLSFVGVNRMESLEWKKQRYKQSLYFHSCCFCKMFHFMSVSQQAVFRVAHFVVAGISFFL